MIALDTNLLVYSYLGDSPLNRAAFEVVTKLAESREPWAIPWPCLHEFLAVTTNPRFVTESNGMPGAIGQIEAWMESPSLVLIGEDASHWATLRDLLATGDVLGGMVHDARIAAICLRHGVSEFWTADRDFSHFPSLKTRNPLDSA